MLGEPVKETTPTVRSEGGFDISQCYFTLPTVANSAVITVTQKGVGADARDPKSFWQEKFSGERLAAQEREEKDEKKAKPVKVDGIGDDAFWSGNAVGGALYVLRGNSFIRVSVGGASDQATKTQKCKALAEIILKHL